MKRLPNNKTNEELLKELNSVEESQEEISSEEDGILTFLRFYNIEAGKNKIKARYLYKLYKQFTKNPKNNKSFNIILGYYLPFISEKGNIEKCYLLNQKVLNLSKRALEFLEKEPKRPKHRSLPWIEHFNGFIKKYDIKAGSDENYVWVSSFILFDLYDKWVYEIRKKRNLSKFELIQLCKASFLSKKDSITDWFKIDTSITKHLSREVDEKIKARNSLTNETKEKQKK